MDHLNCSRKGFRELLSTHPAWALHHLSAAGFGLQDFHHLNSKRYAISKGVRLKNSFKQRKKQKTHSILLLSPAKRLEGTLQLAQKEELYQVLTQTLQ